MKNRPFFAAPTVLALAALAALSAAPADVQALGVGRLNVQSALGEGMRAEIDITSLSAEESASLAVRVAPPEAYRAAGVDYNAVLSSTQASIVRRGDGRAVLRLSSDRAVQEPFVEVILEISWASGRLVREFTLLFDPPGSRNAPPVQAAAPTAPVFAAAPPAAPVPQPAPVANRPAALPAPVAANRPPALAAAPVAPPVRPAPGPNPSPAPSPAPAPVAAAPRAPAGDAPRQALAGPATSSSQRYAVKSGDTLYRVAGRTQPAGVSLDQMLVGLYRANPDAFIDRNVNKLRSGAVMAVPTADEVKDVTPADMRRLISAQSLDFSAYRNRLAQAAPLAQAPEPGRAAQGKVQASVDDRKQVAQPSPDKLKLSGAAASAASLATERQDNAAKVAELSRNIEALKKLQQGAASAPAVPGGPVAAAPAPTVPVVPTTPAAPTPAPPAPVAVAPAPAPAPLPVPTPAPAAPVAPAPVAAAPQAPMATLPAAVPAPPDAPAPGLLDTLTANPLLPAGAAVLALGLLGFGAWRLRNRMGKTASETSFLESRMQPDSFFGQSGGQHVDTRDSTRTNASSMGYSLSQLDAIGDVDPVAEADVYLAYGRDLQAEEILKEAMRTTPDRLAVRTKLLEVYAKRRDIKGFELLATQLYALTKGGGPDWARAQELGRQCDPDNQLYLPGGHPEEIILDGERVVVEPLGATTQPHSVHSPPTQPFVDSGLPTLDARTEPDRRMPLGFDTPTQQMQYDAQSLDLDLSQGPDAATARAMEATRPMAASVQRPIDPGLDFDFETPAPAARRAPAVPEPTEHLDLDALAMDLDPPTVSLATTTGRLGSSQEDTTVDFSRFPMSEPGALVDSVPTTPGNLDDVTLDQGDPLTRKLELAEEFRQIGDIDGARDLIEEVLTKAQGTLRSKAQAMLDTLA